MSTQQQKSDDAQLSIWKVIIGNISSLHQMFKLTKGVGFRSSTQPTTVIFGAIAFTILSYFSFTGSAVAANLHSCSNLAKGSIITMISPNTKPIESTIPDLIQRQAQAWETADSDKLIADFAEDSVFIVPGSRFRGKQEIKAAADDYFAQVTETNITINTIIVQGNKGAVEWIWRQRNKETGELSKAEDAIIFELEQGKIKYWREYMDNKSQV
ncbi:MAG: nuclear transport factor 2 family protein [Coleofasciculus sp. B1-GNL1-01]|uniref:nuclear transport factor 2 family protein n=1 Tax=Coleofasciculus sp. B1-GNL1-01 TaxID=3068484 RepID=UPI0032F7094D